MKARSLQDLGALKKELAERERQAAAQEAARRKALAQAQAEHTLFARAVGVVQPLAHAPRVRLGPAPAPPVPTQQLLDEQEALRESLSDDFDVSTLLDTDGDLSYSQNGLGPDVVRKLRKGEWSMQGQIDLHGLRSDDARDALGQFIREATRKGWRCVRVVHGKGLGSPGKLPVLKRKVLRWLVQKSEVLAFVQAKPAEGGAGALMVLLKGG